MNSNNLRMEEQSLVSRNVLVPELYFLISKFLANGPLRETAKVLAQELEHLNILPRRLDWTGQEHRQTLDELVSTYITDSCVGEDLGLSPGGRVYSRFQSWMMNHTD
ncbi:PH-interacting protein-like [Aedes aegypti]|uniref:BRWD/PHIP N-terminal domain-containing protein n=1 Tax=Aedes aegypti TaxID=7159 RepID=A0A903VMQ4_AEDAE|nr:PH-interacting protein-like [Aedes aegypti]